MTSNDYGVETITTVLAALLVIALVFIGVMMPLMMIVKGGHTMGGVAGVGMVMPIVPLVLLGILAYTLYTYSGGSEEDGQTADSSLEELRLAYARGEQSDEEFDNRRNRLRSQSSVADGVQVSNHE